MVRAWIAVIVGMTVLSFPTVAPDHGDFATWRYLAQSGPIAFACDPTPGTYLPNGDPDDYAYPDQWLFSGDPQCAQFDQVPPSEAGMAFGGFPVMMMDLRWNAPVKFDHRGDWVVTSAMDDNSDAGPSMLMQIMINGQDDLVVESCGGPIVVEIPLNAQTPPWQSSDHIYLEAWVFFDTLRPDPVTLAICVGTTGTSTVEFFEGA